MKKKTLIEFLEHQILLAEIEMNVYKDASSIFASDDGVKLGYFVASRKRWMLEQARDKLLE